MFNRTRRARRAKNAYMYLVNWGYLSHAPSIECVVGQPTCEMSHLISSKSFGHFSLQDRIKNGQLE